MSKTPRFGVAGWIFRKAVTNAFEGERCSKCCFAHAFQAWNGPLLRLIVLFLGVKARDCAFTAITYLAVFLGFRGDSLGITFQRFAFQQGALGGIIVRKYYINYLLLIIYKIIRRNVIPFFIHWNAETVKRSHSFLSLWGIPIPSSVCLYPSAISLRFEQSDNSLGTVWEASTVITDITDKR